MNNTIHRGKVIAKRFLMPRRLKFAIRNIINPVFVEVGANDGRTGDPLFELIRDIAGCRAMLIEPIPHLFERLKLNYSNRTACILRNVGISSSVGLQTMYYIKAEAKDTIPHLPAYFEELASFDKEKIVNAVGSTNDEVIGSVAVRTVPLRDLLREEKLDRVDLLQIDTEGYDYEVLKTFPFETHHPRVICYEHQHLSDSDRQSARDFVASHGYNVESWGKDLICIGK